MSIIKTQSLLGSLSFPLVFQLISGSFYGAKGWGLLITHFIWHLLKLIILSSSFFFFFILGVVPWAPALRPRPTAGGSRAACRVGKATPRRSRSLPGLSRSLHRPGLPQTPVSCLVLNAGNCCCVNTCSCPQRLYQLCQGAFCQTGIMFLCVPRWGTGNPVLRRYRA